MAAKKFYEQKMWSYALCAMMLILILLMGLFLIGPSYAPPDSIFDDSDSDGLPNWLDPDDDNDGIPDGSDPNPFDPDTGDDDDDDDDGVDFVTVTANIWGAFDGGDPEPGNPSSIQVSVSYTVLEYTGSNEIPGASSAPPYLWDFEIYKRADGAYFDVGEDWDPSEMVWWDFDSGSWVSDWTIGTIMLHGTWNLGDSTTIASASLPIAGAEGDYVYSWLDVYTDFDIPPPAWWFWEDIGFYMPS